MDLRKRIKAFSELGEEMRKTLNGMTTKYSSQMNHLIETQHLKNPWFTSENVRMAVKSIADELTCENLDKWTGTYPDLTKDFKPFRVGVIMAGNIPLAGFHDFLSVLITGNNVLSKTSSKDADLIRFAGNILIDLNPEFRDRIEFTEATLSGLDAVIASGSNNSSRYFEYYFGKYPNIIRRNRNSVAIIDGDETDLDLRSLGTDVFSYFGLGCRNVSKIYVPQDYDLTALIKNWDNFAGQINHAKYAGNYDFNKAVYIVNRVEFTDTGFLLLKESRSVSSPISVLHYENYKSKQEVHSYIEKNKDKIQCVIGKNHVPFGGAQSPALWDYADGTDTMAFLLKINNAGIL